MRSIRKAAIAQMLRDGALADTVAPIISGAPLPLAVAAIAVADVLDAAYQAHVADNSAEAMLDWAADLEDVVAQAIDVLREATR